MFHLSFLFAVLILMVNFPLDVFAKVRCTHINSLKLLFFCIKTNNRITRLSILCIEYSNIFKLSITIFINSCCLFFCAFRFTYPCFFRSCPTRGRLTQNPALFSPTAISLCVKLVHLISSFIGSPAVWNFKTSKKAWEHPGFAKASNGQEIVEVSTTKF